MKKLKIIFLITLTVCVAGCSKSDNIIDDVLEDTGSGAILRTLSVNSGTFDYNDPSKEWSVTVEAQDASEGELLSEVGVYVGHYRDGAMIGTEEQIKSIRASEFAAGQNGLPVGDVEVSLSEVLNALELSQNEYSTTDEFRIRLEYVTTDGRTFTNTDAAGTVLNSAFFQSPYLYPVQFFCSLDDASIFEGTYTVTADAWADYAVGDEIPVVHNPDDGAFTFRIQSTNNPYISNTDSYMLVTVDPATGSATVTSNEPFDYSGTLIPVSGGGEVGTCTGSMDLSLNFEGYASDQGFSLVKN